jgi:hypothetical protein
MALLVIWGPEIKLRIQNFENWSPKGTSHTNSDPEWKNDSFSTNYTVESGGTFVQ